MWFLPYFSLASALISFALAMFALWQVRRAGKAARRANEMADQAEMLAMRSEKAMQR